MIKWQSIHKFGKEMFWTKNVWCQGPKIVDQKYFWPISDPKKSWVQRIFSPQKLDPKKIWGNELF